MLGNTLAASFIWGINTIFLLDAGLSNLEAFAANAFFTAGMVLFEVPTGIVADTVGRRASYLLGTVTLTRVDAALRAAVADRGAVLGVGARVDAARPRLHVLLRRGRGVAGRRAARDRLHRRRSSRSSGAARSSAGAAMLTGSVAGGFIAAADSLGVPVRAARRRARRDVRGRLPADARRRLHARARAAGRSPRCARSPPRRSSTAGACPRSSG